jgi:hypothetical protein
MERKFYVTDASGRDLTPGKYDVFIKDFSNEYGHLSLPVKQKSIGFAFDNGAIEIEAPERVSGRTNLKFVSMVIHESFDKLKSELEGKLNVKLVED